jgi:hypothetical protein
MDVIGFLCESLGSIIVQFHDSLGSRRPCACLMNVLPKSCVLLYDFYEHKDSVQTTFIQKYFLFTVRSDCRVKRFTTGCQTFRWWRGWNGGAEVAETTVKRLLCCGFGRTDKAMGQVYQCWWRICREINVFSTQVRISHVLRFMSNYDLFTVFPS